MACNKALVLMITLNILFFTLVSSTSAYPPNPASAPPPVSTTPPPKPSTPPPVSPNSCLKLNFCAKLADGLLSNLIETPKNAPCCKVISGLADLEAAVCVCTALKATNPPIPIGLPLVINACGKKVPSGFQCAN